MQAYVILGIQENILIRNSPFRRCLIERWIREKDHRRLPQIHATIQQGQSKQQEQDIVYHTGLHAVWCSVKARLTEYLLAILDSSSALPMV